MSRVGDSEDSKRYKSTKANFLSICEKESKDPRGAIKNDNLTLKSLSVNLPAKKVLRTLRKDEFYIIVLSRGGGVLPYTGYIGMCRCEGYGFQAVYSRIGYINQSVWL